VIWEFAGEPIDHALLGDLRRLRTGLDAGGEIRTQLVPLLLPQEIEATERRLDALLDARRLPEPGGERPYPWPAI
jgi:hypothetical protein